MAVYGYARVSTNDQDLTAQREALTAAGCEIIREEKRSGTKMDGREELQTLLSFMREGDILVVTRIDRLARSMVDFSNIVHDLKRRGISIRIIKQGIDTSEGGPVGNFMMNMLAAVAEFETELRRERQMEGIALNKAEMRDDGSGKKKYAGGKKRFDDARIRKLHEGGMGVTEIMREIGAKSRMTVYRALEIDPRASALAELIRDVEVADANQV